VQQKPHITIAYIIILYIYIYISVN
jgi:hypothetical protein